MVGIFSSFLSPLSLINSLFPVFIDHFIDYSSSYVSKFASGNQLTELFFDRDKRDISDTMLDSNSPLTNSSFFFLNIGAWVIFYLTRNSYKKTKSKRLKKKTPYSAKSTLLK